MQQLGQSEATTFGSHSAEANDIVRRRGRGFKEIEEGSVSSTIDTGYAAGASPAEIRFMFRLEIKDASEKLDIRIEGRIAGEFADEIRTLVARRKLPAVVVVDISEVTFLDDVGEEVLCWLARIGGRFVAEKFYSRHVSEALRLPLARKA